MRADKFFAEKYGSRTKAAQALSRGLVLRNGKVLFPKDEVFQSDRFVFRSCPEIYVSQGGYKLSRGLEVFGESVEGCTFADLGASTGGFTDCLLQRGARKVFCVDVGESLLHDKISSDPHVTVMDNTNARYLKKDDFSTKLDGIVTDVSFISLRLILGAVSEILDKEGRAFVLFKPQFECGGKNIGKSGILPRKFHRELLFDFYNFCLSLSLAPLGIVNAPVREKKNIEYVIFLRKEGSPIALKDFLQKADTLYEEEIL